LAAAAPFGQKIIASANRTNLLTMRSGNNKQQISIPDRMAEGVSLQLGLLENHPGASMAIGSLYQCMHPEHHDLSLRHIPG
jgi:hypothetical protein